MAKQPDAEVLIVGAGPVGLCTALCLAQRGLQVQIVDEEFRTAAHSYALALHPRSLELLDRLGFTEDLSSRGYVVDTVAFYEGAQRCGELKLAALGGKFPHVLALPQSILESMLEQRLRAAGVKVQWNHRVAALQIDGPQMTAGIDKLTRASCGYAVATAEWVTEKTISVSAAFVVGADGHRSVVRRTLGAEYAPAGQTTSFAVFEFHTPADLGREVAVVFHEDTTSVLWPLPGGRCRWSFELEHAELHSESRLKRRLTVPVGRQAFPHLTRDDLNALIRARAPWFEGRVGELSWSMEVRFDRRLATRFGDQRCWLAGDAAHLTGPVGGQSLNMGIRESFELSDKLAGILRRQAPLDSLARYNEEFVSEWRRLLGIEGGLTPGDRAQPWAERHCARILPCIPATGDDLAKLVAQIGLVIDRRGKRVPGG